MPAVGPSGLKIQFDHCTYSAAQTPWVPGRGWAPVGQTWTYLPLELADKIYTDGEDERPSGLQSEAVRYEITGARLVSRTGIAPYELAPGAGSSGAGQTLVLTL